MPKDFDEIAALVPDVVNPASALAKKTALSFIQWGDTRPMSVHKSLGPDQLKIIRQIFAYIRNECDELPGFVVLPVIAHLLDAWCVEDK